MKNTVSKMVTCWHFSLKNGQVLCFTDADQDIIFNNYLYISGCYFTPSRIISSNELGEDNFAISGIIDEEILKKDALLSGEFDEGFIEVFLINVENCQDKAVLKTGWLSEIKIEGNNFIAQVRSLSSKTNNVIGKCYSSSCRAEFGDQQCKLNKEAYSFMGEITDLAQDNSFVDENRQEPDDYFTGGIVTFLKDNRSFTVKEFRDNNITLDFVHKLNINIGDKYKIVAGCNKSFLTCIQKFNNVINFRGEPFIPSRHQLVC